MDTEEVRTGSDEDCSPAMQGAKPGASPVGTKQRRKPIQNTKPSIGFNGCSANVFEGQLRMAAWYGVDLMQLSFST